MKNKKYIFLIVIFIYFFIMCNEGFTFNNQIIVNQEMSFGAIQYENIPSIYKIGENNTLQSNNRANNYSGNSKLAKITIYGTPNDEITLNFGIAKLIGNFGEITLSNIETTNGNNIITLDNTGKASVELTGTLNINNPNLIGQHKGTFIVWGSYKNQRYESVISQNVGVTVNLFPKSGNVVNSLDFGTILYKKNTSCTVTIFTNNSINHNCLSVSGSQRLEYAGTTLLAILPINLTLLPSSSTLTGSNGDTLTLNNFNSTASKSLLSIKYILYVGATLNIPPTAQGGVYTGTYNVTILIP